MGALAITGVGGCSGIVQQVTSAPPEWLEVQVTTTAPGQTYSWEASAGTSVSSTTDWGDGSGLDTQAGVGIRTKTYAAAGVYTVRIQASFGSGGAMNMRPNADRTRLAKVLSPIPNFAGLSVLSDCFNGCTGLTSLPADLLRYTVNVNNLSFFIHSCPNIASLPTDLLRYTPLVTSLRNFAVNCSGLSGTLAVDFFRHVPLVVDYSGCFFACIRLRVQPDLFGPTPQNFFSTRTPNFAAIFFNTGTFAGTPQGTAPAMWDYIYGGPPTTTNCFAGNSTSLSNWAQIPIAWGGPA